MCELRSKASPCTSVKQARSYRTVVSFPFLWKSHVTEASHSSRQSSAPNASPMSPQSGRWQFAVESSVIGGKPARISEAVSSGNLGDARRARIFIAQNVTHLLHAAEIDVTARAYAQVLLAALAQQPLRNTDFSTDIGHARNAARREQILKARENVSVATCGTRFFMSLACQETLDQGMDQLLLQPVRRFGIDKCSRTSFGPPNSRLVQATHLPYCRERGPPSSGIERGDECGSVQRAPIL
jgi:hypothetical protein